MNNNLFEMGPVGPGSTKDKRSYQQYHDLGGIINEKDYESALARAGSMTAPDKARIAQAKGIADFAGIKLLKETEGGVIDPIIILYGILRSDVQPKEIKYHHQQMTDQRIFAEALRMLGDVDSLDTLIKAYPNIFKEEEDEEELKKAA
jgi:hypothetical protein